MPRVPAYGGRRVAPAPLPAVRAQGAATLQSEGAGVAEAMGGFGAQVGQSANAWLQQVLARRKEVQERAEFAEFQDADRQLMNLDHELLTNPETGALAVHGLAVRDVYPKTMSAFDQGAGNIEATLTSDKARELFARARDSRRGSIAARLDSHAIDELDAYSKREASAHIDTSVSSAIANYSDPERLDTAVERAKESINFGAQVLGLGPDARQLLMTQKLTQLHGGVIEQFLAADRADQAQQYFDRVHGQIDPNQVPEIADKVDAASAASAGLRAADLIWAKRGPKNDEQAIELDRMEDDARTLLAEHPKVVEATIRYLRERKAGVDDARKERRNSIAGPLWLAVADGKPLTDIRQMPEFRNAPSILQAEIADRVVQRAEHEAGRAAAAENRAYTAETRAYTRAERADKQKLEANWTRYYELSKPDTLAARSEDELNAMRGELGDEHVNRLLNEKRKLTNPASVVDASMDRAMLDDLIRQSHVSVDKAAHGRLLVEIEDAIDSDQRAKNGGKGGKLTRDETRAAAQKVIDQRVMLERTFRADEERILATVVEPSDRARAYVPADRMPSEVLTQYANTVRGFSADLQRMPEAELRRRFAARFQHAYALKLLGGATRAEIEAALKGEP